MFLTWEARIPCMLCGCRLRALLMDGFRINKRSIRAADRSPSFGAWDRVCPECLTPATALPHRQAYALTADSAAKVRAYRLRRWPELAREQAVSA